jgi:hypothetical protein
MVLGDGYSVLVTLDRLLVMRLLQDAILEHISGPIKHP